MAKAKLKSIEGLRALAIASVVAYHLEVGWLPSGHMGVVMFLVLTGYLVTNSLLREFDRTGTVNLLGFWGRRVKRIWPPLAAMVLTVCAVCVLFNHVALTKMRPDILPSLLFFDNWNYIANGLSYFDKIGGVSPLTHLWYLGVDMQLCLLWPLVLVGGLKASRNNKGLMMAVAAVLALLSAALMAVLYVPGADPSRVYYGCDTRAFAVLLGAVLAFAWPLGYMPAVGRDLLVQYAGEHRVRDERDPRGYIERPVYRPSKLAEASGFAGLAGLVAIMIAVPSTSMFFFYGGMVLVALLTGLVLVSLLSPGSLLGRAFSCAPLQWLGSRSFSLYLWHYPVMVLLDADGYAAWWLKVIAVAISLALAEIAWRLVEKPLGDKELMAYVRQAGASFFARMPQLAGTASCAVLLLVGVIGCIVVPETTLVPKDAISSNGEAVDKARDLTAERDAKVAASTQATTQADGQAATDGTQTTTDSTQTAGGQAQDGANSQGEAPATTDTPANQEQPAELTLPEGVMSFALYQSDDDNAVGVYSPILIGDSVPPEDGFSTVFPNGYEDAYVGRMPSQAFSIFADYVSQGVVGKVAVFACFTNTTPLVDELETMVAGAPQDTQIFLVGTKNPDGFQDQANANLMQVADAHDNVHYIDWPATAAGHESEYFWDDQTHLRPKGEQAYLDMIARAIAPVVVANGGSVVNLQ
jgi:peptidoglycan/LPS O-acetylase OafA/YrhL